LFSEVYAGRQPELIPADIKNQQTGCRCVIDRRKRLLHLDQGFPFRDNGQFDKTRQGPASGGMGSAELSKRFMA
jgi:hypothetical protein